MAGAHPSYAANSSTLGAEPAGGDALALNTERTGPMGMGSSGGASMGSGGVGADAGGTDVLGSATAGSGTAGANPSSPNRVDTSFAGTGSGDLDVPHAGAAGPGSPHTTTLQAGEVLREAQGTPTSGRRPDVANLDTTSSRVVGAALAGSGTAGSGTAGSGVAGSDVFGTNAAGTDVTEADVTGAGVAGQGVAGAAALGSDTMGSRLQDRSGGHVPGSGKAAAELTDLNERARGAVPGVKPFDSIRDADREER